MTVTLNLSPEQEQLLRQEAEARGVDADDLLLQMLDEAFTRIEADALAALRFPELPTVYPPIRDDVDTTQPDELWTGAEWISFDR